MEFNDSVGDHWKYSLQYNGKTIYKKRDFVIKNENYIKVKAFAYEDDSIRDYGEEHTYIRLPAVGKITTKKIFVYVEENRGRYAGNNAKWVFEVTVKRLA